MKCVICKQGETCSGTTTVTLERGGTTLVVKLVSARVCENCGEAYVDSETTKNLLNTAEEFAKSGAEIDVRNYMAA